MPAEDGTGLDAVEATETLVFPASFGQQRLWVLDRLQPDGTAYTIPLVLRLSGRLSEAALSSALTSLVARHEALRTTFTEVDGELWQNVSPPGPVAVERHDVSATQDPDGAAQKGAAELLSRRFDLRTGPLLRAALWRLADQEHLLAISVHHAIADGWSMGVLKRDIAELYAAAADERPDDLPDLPVQYGDFAEWQRERLDAESLRQELQHWRGVLAGAPALLELPTDRPRPPQQGSDGGHVRRHVDAAFAERLRRYAGEHDATLFMVLLAGFGAYLSRLSGQPDVVIGTPVAGRNRVELEGVIGFFANTLPLRIRLEDEPTFADLVSEARNATVEAYAHQDLPFEKLVAELSTSRSAAHAPITQTLFALQHGGGRPLELPGLQTTPVEIERGTSKFDLALLVLEDEGLRLTFEYATDLFDASTAERMLAQLETLLRAAIDDPSRPVAELSLLGAEERAVALDAGRAVSPQQPTFCLHERFADHAAAAPHAPAVVHEGTLLTYGELDRRANRLAHRLRDLGVSHETPVALCFERSLDMVVAVLAAVKAGGAYVPLDPGYPAERLGYVLGDTRAPVLLTQERLLDRLPRHEATVVCTDRDAAQIGSLPPTPPELDARPDQLAYVIYTSGSTGKPKGVQVEHRQVARLFSATDRWFGFGDQDTWCLLHSYAFDFSVWEMWGALLHGGKLVIPSQTTIQAPDALAGMLVAERVTVLNATPTLFTGVLERLLAAADRLAVRVVIFGGEALRPASLAAWFDHFGAAGPRLVNMYGITETTVHVTYRVIEPEDVSRPGSPIGIPIPDLELRVLDTAGEPLPVGVPGEIYVGGAGVARGYLNRPELTAERFVDNPYGEGRLYRSGDRARRLDDGGVEYLGRNDQQVKIRGYRIELGEIENALVRHGSVAEAAVAAVAVGPGDVRLAAYYVPEPGHPTGTDAVHTIRAHLMGTLPPQMVPASFVAVERLPRTTNGKLDRAALPAPEWGAGSEHVPPSTPTEVELARLWEKILGVDAVGSQHGFFALGGHSMLAVRLFDEVEARFGVRLPLALLFSNDTLAELASAIDRARQPAVRTWTGVVPLRASGSRPPLFVISLGNRNSDFLPYRQLVEQLGSDQPVFGLQSPGMDRRTLPLGTVEELASHYARELRALHPEGPFGIFGLTFAGIVAYELARQLEIDGRRPAFVGGINVAPQLATGRKPPSVSGHPRTWSPYLRRRAANLNHKAGMAFYHQLAKRGRRLPRHSPWDLQLMASSRARVLYKAPPSGVRLDIFGPRSTAHAANAERWRGVAGGGVTYHAVVGEEGDRWKLVFLTRPHVDALAESILEVMSERMGAHAPE